MIDLTPHSALLVVLQLAACAGVSAAVRSVLLRR